MITGCHYQETQFQKPFLHLKITREKKVSSDSWRLEELGIIPFGGPVYLVARGPDGEGLGHLSVLLSR